jgi:hypothetical protein
VTKFTGPGPKMIRGSWPFNFSCQCLRHNIDSRVWVVCIGFLNSLQRFGRHCRTGRCYVLRRFQVGWGRAESECLVNVLPWKLASWTADRNTRLCATLCTWILWCEDKCLLVFFAP